MTTRTTLGNWTRFIALFSVYLILLLPVSFALSINNVQIDTQANSATVTWETNVPANSTIRYGNSTAKKEIAREPNYKTEHSITLYDLFDTSKYFFSIFSSDEEGLTEQVVGDFYTKDPFPPSQVQEVNATEVSDKRVVLRWAKNPEDDIETYAVYREGKSIYNTTQVQFTDNSVNASTSYVYEVSAIDRGGNIGPFSDPYVVITPEPDTTPPLIDSVRLAALTVASATIAWTTDEEADGRIFYGATDLDQHRFSPAEVINHTLSIAGLEEGTTYRYLVQSCDENGNCANSSESTLVPGSDVTPPTLFMELPTLTNEDRFEIKGETEPLSYIKVFVNDAIGTTGRSDENGLFEVTISLATGENTLRFEIKDEADNLYEEERTLTLDNIAPTVSLSAFPEYVVEDRFSLNGTVSEAVDITYYVTKLADLDRAPPPQVTGLSVGDVTETSIALSWNEVTSDDLDTYVIYRDDVRIATSNSPQYIDRVVSGVEYSYAVSTLDKQCNEGAPSILLKVTSKEGGVTTLEKPDEISLPCGGAQQTQSVPAGSFSQTLSLHEGGNHVRIVFSDEAGNTATFEGTVAQDTKPPTILSSRINELSPSYTKNVEIEGQVDEFASVYVYVGDEDEPYIGVTDSEGYFSVDVELQKGTGAEFTQDPNRFSNDQQYDSNLTVVYNEGWRNNVRIIAVDSVGLKSQEVKGEITYAICGFGSYYGITINEGSLTPDILNPRLILNGQAQIAFAVNLSWQGSGDEPEVNTQPRVRIRPLSVEDAQDWDEEWVSFLSTWDRDNNYQQGYVLIDIKPQNVVPQGENWTMYEQEENISSHREGECLVPGFGCVKVPLQLEVEFFDPVYEETVRQRQCWDIEVSIDQRLNPDVIPHGFLQTSVDILGTIVDLIEDVLEPLNEIKKIVFYACVVTWVLLYVYALQKNWACEYNSAASILVGDGAFQVEVAETGQCKEVYDDTEGNKESLENCQSCMDKIQAYNSLQVNSQYVCDRIFCPSAPSFQKYVRDVREEYRGVELTKVEGQLKSDFDLTKKDDGSYVEDVYLQVDSRSDCADFDRLTYEGVLQAYQDYKEVKAGDGKISVEGKEINCKEPHNSNPKCCGYEYMREWDSACGLPGGLLFDELKESVCYAKQYASDEAIKNSKSKVDEAIKNVNDDGTPVSVGATTIAECDGFGRTVWNSVAGLCEADGSAVPDFVNTRFRYKSNGLADVEEQKSPEELIKGLENEEGVSRQGNVWTIDNKKYNKGKGNFESAFNGRIHPNDETCESIQFNSDEDNHIYYRIIVPEGEKENYYVHRGYITKKTYISGEALAQSNPNGATPVSQNLVFKPMTQNIAEWFGDPKQEGANEDNKLVNDGIYNTQGYNSFASDLRKCSDSTITSKTLANDAQAKDLYKEIQEKLGYNDKEYIVDPTSSLFRSIQCLCLPGISSYLSLWKAMLESVRQCLQSIIITGDGDTGVCQAVLTQYVCDIVYDLISCFTQKYSLSASGRASGGIGNIVGALTSAGGDVQSSITGRYGDSGLFKAMFAERKLVHAICLWAFTGTWDFDVNALLDADTGFPIDSQGFMYPCERRFVGFDPTSDGITTWNYHMGIGFIAGADVQWNVKLICSDDYSCNYDGPRLGDRGGEACDCIDIGKKEQVINIEGAQRTLNKGDTLDIDEYEQRQDKYRYDKAVLEYTYRNNDGETVIGDPVECSVATVGGEPPVTCHFDAGLAMYRCGYEVGGEDYVVLNGVRPSQTNPYVTNEHVQFNAEITQRIPETRGCNDYLNCPSTKYLSTVITNKEINKVVYKTATPVFDGETGRQNNAADSEAPKVLLQNGVYTVTYPTGFTLKKEHFEAGTGQNKGFRVLQGASIVESVGGREGKLYLLSIPEYDSRKIVGDAINLAIKVFKLEGDRAKEFRDFINGHYPHAKKPGYFAWGVPVIVKEGEFNVVPQRAENGLITCLSDKSASLMSDESNLCTHDWVKKGNACYCNSEKITFSTPDPKGYLYSIIQISEGTVGSCDANSDGVPFEAVFTVYESEEDVYGGYSMSTQIAEHNGALARVPVSFRGICSDVKSPEESVYTQKIERISGDDVESIGSDPDIYTVEMSDAGPKTPPVGFKLSVPIDKKDKTVTGINDYKLQIEHDDSVLKETITLTPVYTNGDKNEGTDYFSGTHTFDRTGLYTLTGIFTRNTIRRYPSEFTDKKVFAHLGECPSSDSKGYCVLNAEGISQSTGVSCPSKMSVVNTGDLDKGCESQGTGVICCSLDASS